MLSFIGGKRIIKAILIDPFACTITEVEYDGDDYKQIYPLLSHESMKVNTFTCAYPSSLASHDAVYVDDEGLFKNPQRFFLIPSNGQPLAGKGLVIGADDEGESTSAETPLEALKRQVIFLERSQFVHDEYFLRETKTPWQAQ
jgi:hypothetical protein